ENQVLMPIKDHIEMGIENLTDLEQKLGRIAYYPALFSNAFGSDEITSDRIASAMAQFIRSIVSYNTKYDRGQADAFSNFTDLERRGFTIFTQAECDGCHGTQNFGGIEAANIGLEMNYADKGIGDLLGSDQFNGSFKVPSLRNVALTAPYMHDGRFATLEEVIQHYSEAIVAHPNLDFRLTTQSGNGWSDIRPSNSPILHFEFTPLEVEALIAFLHTLTDDVLTTDEKYSNPFR
ncbi:MAG: cytochrome c peroxidase, partial [Bacteroidota bacterium]